VHARKGYSSRSVCLCTADLEDRCFTTVETGMNMKTTMI